MKIKNKLLKNFITAFGVVWLEIFKPIGNTRKLNKASSFGKIYKKKLKNSWQSYNKTI